MSFWLEGLTQFRLLQKLNYQTLSMEEVRTTCSQIIKAQGARNAGTLDYCLRLESSLPGLTVTFPFFQVREEDDKFPDDLWNLNL